MKIPWSNQIKTFKKTIFFKEWEFSFSPEIIKKINEIINTFTKKGLEVGGYLFSDEEMNNKFYSVWTSSPHKNDIFKPYYYELDITVEKRMIKKYCTDINIERKYVVIWHSHRTMGTSPSFTDIENAKRIMKELNNDVFLSLIFNDKELNILIFYWKKNNIKHLSKKIKRERIWIQK